MCLSVGISDSAQVWRQLTGSEYVIAYWAYWNILGILGHIGVYFGIGAYWNILGHISRLWCVRHVASSIFDSLMKPGQHLSAVSDTQRSREKMFLYAILSDPSTTGF